MPFLEIVTRTFKRPRMLAVQQESLKILNDPDWVQTLLVDTVGIGVPEANARMADHDFAGAWLWMLDDDDVCIYPDLIGDLRRIAADPQIGAVIVKADRGGEEGILPPPDHWERRFAALGLIPGCAIIVRHDVWLACRHGYKTGIYSSDWTFILTVIRSKTGVCWHDVVASRTQIGTASSGQGLSEDDLFAQRDGLHAEWLERRSRAVS